jgi:hypothetical protein
MTRSLFKLTADCEFEADDLDTACLTIAEHFLAMAEVDHAVIDGESCTPTRWHLEGGEIDLRKIE